MLDNVRIFRCSQGERERKETNFFASFSPTASTKGRCGERLSAGERHLFFSRKRTEPQVLVLDEAKEKREGKEHAV